MLLIYFGKKEYWQWKIVTLQEQYAFQTEILADISNIYNLESFESKVKAFYSVDPIGRRYIPL